VSEEKTYLFKNESGEHIEVVLTGRTAKDKLKAVGTAQERTINLVQITPVEIDDGRWKKFVRKELLIEVDVE